LPVTFAGDGYVVAGEVHGMSYGSERDLRRADENVDRAAVVIEDEATGPELRRWMDGGVVQLDDRLMVRAEEEVSRPRVDQVRLVRVGREDQDVQRPVVIRITDRKTTIADLADRHGLEHAQLAEASELWPVEDPSPPGLEHSRDRRFGFRNDEVVERILIEVGSGKTKAELVEEIGLRRTNRRRLECELW
jgi:hypothetical protein